MYRFISDLIKIIMRFEIEKSILFTENQVTVKFVSISGLIINYTDLFLHQNQTAFLIHVCEC